MESFRTAPEVTLMLARTKAETLSPTQLYRLVLDTAKTTPMQTVVDGLVTYFYDDIDEINYTHIE